MRSHFLRAVPKVSVPTVSYLTNFTQTASTTNTTTGVSFGTENSTRRIYIMAVWRNATNIASMTSATIGGVSATLYSSTQIVNANANAGIIFAAEVPTGTTGTVVTNFNVAPAGGAICFVFSVLNQATALASALNSSGSAWRSSASVSQSTTSMSLVDNGFSLVGTRTFGGTFTSVSINKGTIVSTVSSNSAAALDTPTTSGTQTYTLTFNTARAAYILGGSFLP
jgi:hypothetical protein